MWYRQDDSARSLFWGVCALRGDTQGHGMCVTAAVTCRDTWQRAGCRGHDRVTHTGVASIVSPMQMLRPEIPASCRDSRSCIACWHP